MSSYLWTARRFGLTPRKFVARVSPNGLPKVLCVSLPKAGTHLIERAVCLHPKLYRKILPTLNPQNVGSGGLERVLGELRPGQVTLAHLPFEASYPDVLAREGVEALFVIRDPRDIVVSLAHFIADHHEHPLHRLYAAQGDLRSRIAIAIAGEADARPPAPPLAVILDGFAGWLESGAQVVRFEDLIGPRGGGDGRAQERTVDAIYDHLGLPAPSELHTRVFSHASPTFRKGLIGQWHQHFDPELETLYEREVGGWMEAYGYR